MTCTSKRTYLLISAVFLLPALIVHGQAKIGYIDSQKILATYAPAVDAEKQLEAENKKWMDSLQKMETDFQTRQEELEKQSLLLSEEKKKEKTQELQQLALEAQQYQNEKWGEQGEYFKLREQLLKPIFDQINVAINVVGEDEGFHFIFDAVAGNLVFAKEEFDVTDKVLQILEKKTTSENTQ